MTLQVTQKEYDNLIASANEAIGELGKDLSNLSVNVGKGSTDVLTAIKYIFGPKYIQANGTSTITYEMFSKVAESLRTAGKLKVGEYL